MRSRASRPNLRNSSGGMARESATRLVLDLFVALDLAVSDRDDAVRVHGDVVLVGDEADWVAALVQALEQGHDFVAGGGVESAGGLIGQENRRVVDERASDGDTLALTAGELVGLMVHAALEVDLLHGDAGHLLALVGG